MCGPRKVTRDGSVLSAAAPLRADFRPWPVPIVTQDEGVSERLYERLSVVNLGTEVGLFVAHPDDDVSVRTSRSGVVLRGELAVVRGPGSCALASTKGLPIDLVRISRARFQILASAQVRAPRRLRSAVTTIAPTVELNGILRPFEVAEPPGLMEDQVCHLLIQAIDASDPGGQAWFTAPTLRRAVDYVLSHPEGDCSPGAVADAAGMTVRTLQRGMNACLGVSLTTFVRDVRLTFANAGLKTRMESRSIDTIARKLGFASSSAFARFYRGRFDETPAQTRSKAVREG